MSATEYELVFEWAPDVGEGGEWRKRRYEFASDLTRAEAKNHFEMYALAMVERHDCRKLAAAFAGREMDARYYALDLLSGGERVHKWHVCLCGSVKAVVDEVAGEVARMAKLEVAET